MSFFNNPAPATSQSNPAAPSSLFGSISSQQPAGAAPTNIFGGGIFGSKPAATANPTAAPATTSIFGSNPDPPKPSFFNIPPAGSSTTPTPNLFGQPAPASTTPSLSSAPPLSSGLFGSSAASGSTTPSLGAAPPLGSGLFGNKPATTPAPAAAPVLSGGLFGATATTSTSTEKKDVPPAAPSLFNMFKDKEKEAPKPAAPSLFGNPTASTSGAATAEKKDAPPAAAPSLFGSFGAKPAEKKDAPAASFLNPPKDGEKPKETLAPVLGLSALGAPQNPQVASTIAVAPPSMLRGKTIEEIVNRWSADLETHVREFNKFASEVAVWDRGLIENGNHLAALFSHVLAAEREQDDIDQSLDHIEQQQKDLASTLDAYEKSAHEMLGGQGSFRTVDTGPADTERDRNYTLATNLHSHLDDLSGSLTQMIETVNGLSPLSDNQTSDDPMAQIAEILSSHLESLQWIDGAVREVETKVADVEKRVQDSGVNTNMRSSVFGANR